ncbi:Rhamnogalacturonase B, N-terminal-domain-containing protein [Aspergillus avenaceus]|uniref:rhamnogalacturonan endolyase n=1 Tax=Aspergillus avenaceus TaxID=36643 RepID=A0A5N6TW91_ASPAV|nr:Rhamnogalacturonase B, N-terminal-domain-containing protein [Aspergillus avenaceus]
MKVLSLLLAFVTFPLAAYAAFGYTDNGSEYVIDSGASLVIKVSKTNGDISSMVYNGVEYQGYSGRNTQVEAGLGSSTVTIEQFSSPAPIIKVAVVYKSLKHYIVVRSGNDNVYLFTNKGDDSVAASRYIVRLKGGIFSHEETESDYIDSSETVEAHDILINSDGYTKSKHYQGSNYGRVIDFDYVGRSTDSVGVWLIRSNHEKASGGPFFRSLVCDAGPETESLYEIYFYSMGHTDPQRFGLQGPTVLSFTGGEAPNSALFAQNADWSWIDTLGIDGWTTWADRGWISGVGISGMKLGYEYTVGLSNTDAQYWTKVSSGAAWMIKHVLPGTYTLTVYKKELEVFTSEVTISAGKGSAMHTITLNDDPADVNAIWRIGDWDGTPAGFLNFDAEPMLPTYMHPSDGRLSPWKSGNFIVGTSDNNTFPGYMWTDVNNGHLVYFKLSKEQYTSAHTIRVGLTEAYINGRPQITVNEWTSKLQTASSQGGTRSLTVGTYRGNNVVFSFDVPASAWVQSTSEWQVLKINVVSGSTGSGYLSPAISFDCVDMI